MTAQQLRAFKDSLKTESTGIQKEVIAYLELRRIWYRRYNSGLFRSGSRRIRAIYPHNGHPDLMARAPVSGRVVWIECKSKDGVLSAEQIVFRDEVVHRFGDLYVEARTLDDVRQVFEPDHFLRSPS